MKKMTHMTGGGEWEFLHACMHTETFEQLAIVTCNGTVCAVPRKVWDHDFVPFVPPEADEAS